MSWLKLLLQGDHSAQVIIGNKLRGYQMNWSG
jgi:hypothetical protein